MPIHEPPTDIADQALARAWAALTAARFESFPSLAAFLAYLRTCVMATAIDHAREQNTRARNEQLAQIEAAAVSPEQTVLEELQQAELWRLILSTAKSEQEQLLVRESLLYALPPRAIYARHPDQFANCRGGLLHEAQSIQATSAQPSYRTPLLRRDARSKRRYVIDYVILLMRAVSRCCTVGPSQTHRP